MAAEALEQSALESKDKDQLTQIAKALGVKGISKLKKADLVTKIIDATGGADEAPLDFDATPVAEQTPAAPAEPEAPAIQVTDGARGFSKPRSSKNAGSARAEVTKPASKPAAAAADDGVVLGPDGEPLADWEIELHKQGVSTETTAPDAGAGDGDAAGDDASKDKESSGGRDENGRRNRNDGQRNDGRNRNGGQTGQNRDGQTGQNRDGQAGQSRDAQGRDGQGGGNRNNAGGNAAGGGNRNNGGGNQEGDGNKRRRRRRKGGNRGQEGPQGDDIEFLDDDGQPPQNEPVDVTGYLDIRDEGYGFLRVGGYLPSKDDAYISVKLTRQFGLRKGDEVAGKMRPARGNEKNPQLVEVFTVNGDDPEAAKKRPRFENLTALFPDEKLRLEDLSDPSNMTARIIDLISPIGKGQRGILVSPPKAGKTTILKTIAKMIEKNNPEVELIVLLIDERPEEVTDIKRTVKGEVISSTFDRPSDEHAAVAEMTIAKARRMVESGKDVVIMLDGITRLSRAYNLAAPSSGKILSGGIDAGALYPPKKFFGSARNVEEGGSLTILATALVDTNSRMDEAIFEEFKGTGNMELRLDRKIAERRIYPAIDVDASSTRHEELLFDRKELQMVWKLRRVLSGLAAEGSAAPGLELLMDRLKTFKSNSEFLNEIAKQPGM